MQEQDTFRFAVTRMSTAMQIILTPEGSSGTNERWERETKSLADTLEEHLPVGGTLVDFGSGIGRLTKALLQRRPDARAWCVDSSPDMRKLTPDYLGDLVTRVSIVDQLDTVPSGWRCTSRRPVLGDRRWPHRCTCYYPPVDGGPVCDIFPGA